MKQYYLAICVYFDNFTFLLSGNWKPALKYLAGSIAITLYLGIFCFTGKNSDAGIFLAGIQVLAFLFMGILHLFLLRNYISIQRLKFSGVSIVYSFFVSIMISLALLIFYLFTNNSMAVMAIFCSVAFILPQLVFQTWLLLKNIPAKEYPLWTQPSNLKDNDELLLPEIITFKFQLPARINDQVEKIYYKTIPVGWKLGKAFFSLFDNQGNGKNIVAMIESRDEKDNPYGWEFYSLSAKGLIKKRFDPENTFLENRIKNNSVVHVKRIKCKPEPAVRVIHYSDHKQKIQAHPIVESELIGHNSKAVR